jgi:broad specificity phosphatase PhoE
VTRRLILVRHGESEANVTASLHCRVPGPPLTPLGQRQSAELVPVLADEDVRMIWASTMLRAQQTAAPLAAARWLPVRIHEGLRESDVGDLHDRHDDEAHGVFDDVFGGWALDGDLTLRCPGGESAAEITDRFAAALEEVLAELSTGTAVVFSHSAALRLTLLGLCGLSPAFVLRHHLANAAYAVVDLVGGRYTCRTWGGLLPELAGEPVGPGELAPGEAPRPY